MSESKNDVFRLEFYANTSPIAGDRYSFYSIFAIKGEVSLWTTTSGVKKAGPAFSLISNPI